MSAAADPTGSPESASGGTALPAALLAELAAVEAACFDEPWGAAGLADTLAAGHTGVAWLRAASGEVAAYCLYQQLVDELEILQVATHPDQQRRGLGRRLVALAAERAAATGCGAVILEVRRSNAAALALYASAGFTVCGVRRGYYPARAGGAAEDALLLRWELPPRPNSG